MELLIFWALCGILAAIIANSKHRSVGTWAMLGIFLGPVAVLVLVFLPAIQPASRENVQHDDLKPCPQCAEPIRLEAIKCRYCGASIDLQNGPETVLTAEMADKLVKKLTAG